MRIPYGYCQNTGTPCPQLSKGKSNVCSRGIYWMCLDFKRAGMTTVKMSEITNLEDITKDALIQQYNIGKTI